MIVVRCGRCDTRLDPEGYPSLDEAMTDLVRNGHQVSGDESDPDVICRRCASIPEARSGEAAHRTDSRPLGVAQNG